MEKMPVVGDVVMFEGRPATVKSVLNGPVVNLELGNGTILRGINIDPDAVKEEVVHEKPLEEVVQEEPLKDEAEKTTVPVSKMNKAELTAFAAAEGIDISGCKTVKDIRAAIADESE